MGDISEHFSRHEVACPCGCGFDGADYDLIMKLEWSREELFFGRRVFIISWCRCAAHNATIPGASSKSQHLYAKAADIQVEGMRPPEVYRRLDRAFPNRYGLGLYPAHVHFDSRTSKARWTVDAYPTQIGV